MASQGEKENKLSLIRSMGRLNPYQLNDYYTLNHMLSKRFSPLERKTVYKYELKIHVKDYRCALSLLVSQQAYLKLDRIHVQLLNKPETLEHASSFAL